jgi:tRNA dimethylallyltransferase
MGPTATGKTRLSLELAQKLPVEIISVDSAMVYRGMDIGTGKPSLAEQAAVPHHLLDVCSPDTPFSAAHFRTLALKCIADIQSRGKHPLLVGGTLLYFQALQQGLSPLPEKDDAMRLFLEQEAQKVGWAVLHARLVILDPKASQTIKPTDTQRIQRALEVIYLTGKTLTEHFQSPPTPPPNLTFYNMALTDEDRAALHTAIEQRFDAMCRQGLIEEVIELTHNVPLMAQLPAARSVGYRQVLAYLAGSMDKPTMREKAIAATRQLAKRQMTWLRSWPAHQTFDWQAV